MKILRRVHLHPFIIGMYPVISLYAYNQSQLEPNAPLRSLMVINLGVIIAFFLMYLFIKNWTLTSYIVTFCLLLFFLYGPAKSIMHNIHFASINLGWNRYFFPIWLVVLILGIWLIVYKLPRGEKTTMLINIVSLAAITIPFISITSYIVSHLEKLEMRKSSYDLTGQNSTALAEAPDVYYIILDMYGRSDTIEKEFGYDNSDFLETLKRQGFYVAACSTSNYTGTVLSMTSSLNMNYLMALGDNFTVGNGDFPEAGVFIRNNAVRQYLKYYGYSYISFESNYPWLNTPDSDVYIGISAPKKQEYLSPFELLLIEQTPGGLIFDRITKVFQQDDADILRTYGLQYDWTLFILEQLSELPISISSPKFVYAHLIIPHPPYVFGPNGEYIGNDERLNGGPDHSPVDDEAYRYGYTSQVQYIDYVIPKVVKDIISKSEKSPVIIIQGDHGFWGEPDKRFPILNAYFLPGVDPNQVLYPRITPVNTFRVVLNEYFNGQFALLPDKNYVSKDGENPFDVIEYENAAIECMPK